MRILVVGAGWYGCHIASVLLDAGYDVVVIDEAPDVLSAASGNNQFRLHMGLHYPRSLLTRQQTIAGYHRFLRTYPQLAVDVQDNLYAIDAAQSLLDFGTFCQVMQASSIPYTPVPTKTSGLKNIEGVVRCDEKVLLTDAARAHFLNRLGASLQLGRKVEHIESHYNYVLVDGEQYDFMVNCTWFKFRPLPGIYEHYYEPTLLFYYTTTRPDLAITIMDGPFCSIYPCGDGRSTLSSVPLTPVGRYATAAEGLHRLNTMATAEIDAVRRSMEEQAEHYYPAFNDAWTFDSVQRALKTKLPSGTDMRACFVSRIGREIWVFAGKIDTIFTAEDEVLTRISEVIGGPARPHSSAAL